MLDSTQNKKLSFQDIKNIRKITIEKNETTALDLGLDLGEINVRINAENDRGND